MQKQYWMYLSKWKRKTAFQTVSSNISAGGIAVVMPEHISAEPGEKLYVSFFFPARKKEADITAEALTQRIFMMKRRINKNDA